MAELTWIPGALRAFGAFYLVLALIALAYALIKPQTARQKGRAVAGVVVLFAGLPIGAYIAGGDERQQQKEHDAKLAEAKALFEERCKGAGEKIHRTVDNVEGVVWMKWREPISNADNFADQYKLNDPYGRDCGGEDCVVRLLRVTKGAELNPERSKQRARGYRFVETSRPSDGQLLRYTGLLKLRPQLTEAVLAQRKAKTGDGVIPADYEFFTETEPIEKFTARYGVTWDDISTKEDRDHWIAGGSLKVIDLQTNEVIAERVGYMVDWGQGSEAGGRSPWLFAEYMACPAFPQVGPGEARRMRTGHENRNFVFEVLKSSKGE